MPHLLVLLALLRPFPPAAPDDPPTPLELVQAVEQVLGDAIEQAQPSVVAINRIKSEDGQTLAIRGRQTALRPDRIPFPQFGNIDPLADDYIAYDYASGVVVGSAGQILTTHHAVVGAARLIVRAQGVKPFEAEILAADPRSDLAVIAPMQPQVGDAGVTVLRPIPVGDATTLRVGSFLMALGNPFNLARDGQASASWGILANRARSLIPPPSEIPGRPATYQLQNFGTLLQLDSKLNLGMSGGAVINVKGELVAITTASANALGYDPRAGYAIPLDVRGLRALEALVEGKEVEYGFLGIKLENQNSETSNRVSLVEPGTPAGEGGVVQGDLITEINGQPVRDFESLILAVNASPVGEPVLVRLLRQGDALEKSVILSKFPVEGEVIATNRPGPWRGLRVDFSSVVAQNLDLTLEAMARGAIGVVDVRPGSAAEAAGVEPGMVIVGVSGQKVRSPEQFRKLVADLDDQSVVLTVVAPDGLGESKALSVAPDDPPADDD